MTSIPIDAKALNPTQLRRLGRAVPKRLRFTRDGKLLFFVTLGIGFGAVNSGNNLLYLVLGVMLSLIMVSGVLSELNLRGLQAIRRPVTHLALGTPSLVRVTLTNSKRRFASLSVDVTDLTDPDYGLDQRRAFVMSVPRGGSIDAQLRIVGHRRGEVASAGLRVTTRFPFGLFEKSRVIPLPGRYIVTPHVRPVALPQLWPHGHGSEEEVRRVGHGDEFYALRDGQLGDDARAIAWKATARRDKIIVREQQRPATRRVVLVVANVVPNRTPATLLRLEEAFSEVASLASVLVEAGYAVGLATAEGGRPPATGQAQLVALLEDLARLPVRSIAPGTHVPVADPTTGGRSERVAVVTIDQQRAAIEVGADVMVVVGSKDAEDPT